MKVALYADWRDDDAAGPSPDDLSMLKGEVVEATFSVGRDALTLTYADGRQVTLTLHQCKTHSCDDTMMVLEG